MTAFDHTRLRRFPDVEAENLQAWDATDLLLVDRALAAGLPGDQIVVIGDEYGAITLALVHAGLHGIRVHQDLATGRRALVHNAAALAAVPPTSNPEIPDDPAASRRVTAGHAGPDPDDPGFPPGFGAQELDVALLADARLVLLQLPKSLAELEEIADAIARWASPEATLIAGGRVKHMTLGQNEVLARYFGSVQPQRAERKSRLLVATEPRAVMQDPPFPVFETHPEFGLTLAAHGGAFAGARIDIGTRVLLEALRDTPHGASPRTVVDLGCGTGALAASWALAHPDDRVLATDRSAAAVASARQTMQRNGVADRVVVTHDDAGSEIPDAAADVVLLNPPFHLGQSVHTGAAIRLFEAAARMLRPEGELWTVYNSSLAYKSDLTRLVGRTEQVRRTPKFTVAHSIRAGF